ncbi:hypothetical protein R6Q59_001727 [Mikania micrantha]
MDLDYIVIQEIRLGIEERETRVYQGFILQIMWSHTHVRQGVKKVDQISLEQPEIIFMGTGTGEGIPRVSCLTNPIKKCVVGLGKRANLWLAAFSPKNSKGAISRTSKIEHLIDQTEEETQENPRE